METATWSPSNLSRERLLVGGKQASLTSTSSSKQRAPHLAWRRPFLLPNAANSMALKLLQHELDQFKLLVAGIGELRRGGLRLKYKLRRRHACLRLRILDFVQQLSVGQRHADTRPRNRQRTDRCTRRQLDAIGAHALVVQHDLGTCHGRQAGCS